MASVRCDRELFEFSPQRFPSWHLLNTAHERGIVAKVGECISSG